MKKSIEELEKEHVDIVHDDVLHRIGDWKLNNTDNPIDEDDYVNRALSNLRAFKKKCDSALKLFNAKD